MCSTSITIIQILPKTSSTLFLGLLLVACSQDSSVSPLSRCVDGNALLLSATSPCAADDELCSRYLDIWRNQIQKRNDMSNEYFTQHVVPYNASIDAWDIGESFRVQYRVTITWAVIGESDQFVVNLRSSEPAYQHLDIPRDVYLSESEVEVILDEQVFSSSVTRIVSVERLKFCNQQEAVTALQNVAHTDRIGFDRIAYYVPGRLPREDGYPYLFGSGEIDRNENRCITGRLNLVSGIGEGRETVCVITGRD